MARPLIHRLLDKAGIEVFRRPTMHHFLHSRNIDLILDVGANLGFFALAMRQKGYAGRIWSFEPVAYVFETLATKASADPLWQVSRLALGSEPGEAEINVLGSHTMSSLLEPTELAKAYNPGGETRRERVQVETLDRVLADDPASDIFLKLDVQGFEKEVLAGAAETLERCCALQVELPIEPLYEGNWRFTEALDQIEQLGFVPAQFRTVNPLPDDPASAVEFDCLFRRKEPRKN